MPENHSPVDVSSGVDQRASVVDIQDAFARQGLTLTMREVDGHFEAAVGYSLNPSAPSEPAVGASPGQAAHRAWTAHLQQNGGTGQS